MSETEKDEICETCGVTYDRCSFCPSLAYRWVALKKGLPMHTIHFCEAHATLLDDSLEDGETIFGVELALYSHNTDCAESE